MYVQYWCCFYCPRFMCPTFKHFVVPFTPRHDRCTTQSFTAQMFADVQEDQENERATHRSTQRMQAILERNLQQTEWLHPFQPMSYQCPLIGRKVHHDLVPELLSQAWRCDGLGYAWECVSSMHDASTAGLDWIPKRFVS